MRLTAAMFRSYHACEEQVVIFAEEWPEGCEVSVETLLRAIELNLDIDWLACEFLEAPLREEYRRQVTLFWAEYKRQRDPFLAEYKRKRAPLWAEFERKVALLLSSLIAQSEKVQHQGTLERREA